MNNATLKQTVILLVLLASVLLNAASKSSLFQNQMQSDNFRANGALDFKTGETSHFLSWDIKGKQAVVNLPNLVLRNFSMDFADRGNQYNLNLTSPSCTLDQNDRKIISSSPIFITTNGMEISGIGYDIFLEKEMFLITIRQAVEIKIHRKELQMLKTAD